MQGTTRDGEMLPSILSKNLATALGTVRRQPIDFNNIYYGAITCEGVLQPTLTPSSLASMLAAPQGGLGDQNLVKLRDTTVDGIHNFLRRRGQPFQKDLLDQYALSREQARQLQSSVVDQLRNIKDSSGPSNLQAAVLLFKMRVTPVVMTSFDFGGDNHTDTGFANEVKMHNLALSALAKLPGLVSAAGLDGQVTFCMLNVFGRTLNEPNLAGRNHNDGHAVSLVSGANVRGGVVGGVARLGSTSAFRALNIDSATGAGSAAGDVTYQDSLASYGKTLAAAAGLDDKTVDNAFRRGTRVVGALTA